MNNRRFTASARLGVWDALDGGHGSFVKFLNNVSQTNAHAVIESDSFEFADTKDDTIASLTAICDKIIVRGNPTLLDLKSERLLMSGLCQQFLGAEELNEGPTVGFRFSGGFNKDRELRAALEELLLLPFSGNFPSRELTSKMRESVGDEEDRFFDQFKSVFGKGLSLFLHSQIKITDLAQYQRIDSQLSNSRVDFVFNANGIRWVFEIDGEQHKEAAQKSLDKKRDAFLKEHGWNVYRFSNEDVRQGLEKQLLDLMN